ncbi:MAG TPA: aminotransferase class V-fold PLP-dependent enzyme [Pyrinomonadaceae bacterium]|nr:aminotransferase class V-fold PLP-dependent enzyme [Pyrinomonadaceae bacterium]
MIYLDNNATTAVAPEVLDAMIPFLTGEFGNASSSHSAGIAAREAVMSARENVAKLVGAASTDEIVFTSGGTESDNWAIRGAIAASDKRHIVISTVEHEAVRNMAAVLVSEGCEATRVSVNEEGLLDLDELRSSLRSDTAIVSLMTANNETGVRFPIRDAAAIVHEHSDALFHTDAVNAIGKTPLSVDKDGVDLLSISGHKFHAPKGVGALFIRSGVTLPSLSIGGGQESGRRAGTEAVHQIAGLGAAAKLAFEQPCHEAVSGLRDRLENGILSAISCATVNGSREFRLPNTTNISFENLNGEMIMHLLDEAGICVSTGSACNDAHRRSSATLTAMNIPFSRAMGSIRFSLGRYNTAGEIDHVLEVLPPIIERLQSLAA